MKVALILMIKDEVELLEAWLEYHSHLFGAESIFLFDNGSSNSETLKILSAWADRVACINYEFRSPNDYKNKPNIYLDLVRKLEILAFNIFFPMDCDEFIAVETNGQISINPTDINFEISRYHDADRILRIKYALDNTPLDKSIFIRSSQRKCFFYSNVCMSSDHGFHDSRSFNNDYDYIVTNIVYIHYHFRSYEDYVRSAKDKLTPWVSDFSIDSLTEYKGNRRPGFHLIDTILQDPCLYYVRQRSRTNGSTVTRLNSFRDFMMTRGLLDNFNSNLLHFSSDEAGWHVHVDDFQVHSDFLLIKGWAFNEKINLPGIIRLRIDHSVTAPITYKVLTRTDVVHVYGNASASCGFEIIFSGDYLSDIAQVGLFFSSSDLILGHYFELPLH